MFLSGFYEGVCCFRLIKLNLYWLVDILIIYWRVVKKCCYKNYGMLFGMISVCFMYE